MLGVSNRCFSTSVIKSATQPIGKGKAQGFSKRSTKQDKKRTNKKITSGTLYKKWVDTIHTARLNENATSVQLPIFMPKTMNENMGKVSTYSSKQLKHLHHLGSFKKSQFRELFPQPISLLRQDSTQQFLSLISNTNSTKPRRFIITGEPGVGKTTLLAQVHAHAIETDKIVINVSYPDIFLNGRNDFFYDESDTKLYVQPMYLKTLMTKILKGNNSELLKSIPLQRDYAFERSSLKGVNSVKLKKQTNSLYDLLSVTINPNLRGIQFDSILNELYKQQKIPIIFTVDNISRILTSSFTQYRDTNNRPIPTLKLQIANAIMNLISGKQKLNHKESCIVTAISGVDRTNRTLPVALKKMEEDPYIKQYHYDPMFAQILQRGDIQEFEVPKMSRDEVKELINFYNDSNVLSKKDKESKSLEQLTDEKFFVSGNGNPRELLKSVTFVHQ